MKQARIQAIIDKQLISHQQYETVVALRNWYFVTVPEVCDKEVFEAALPRLTKAGLYRDGRPVEDATDMVRELIGSLPRRYVGDDHVIRYLMGVGDAPHRQLDVEGGS